MARAWKEARIWEVVVHVDANLLVVGAVAAFVRQGVGARGGPSGSHRHDHHRRRHSHSGGRHVAGLT